MWTSTDIKTKINEIRHHYNTYLNNKYTKSIMMKLDIPHSVHRDMDFILSNDIIYVDSKGSIEDLYSGIKALVYIIKDIEVKIIPNIKSYMELGKSNYNANEQVLFQMAIKNFPMNVVSFEKKIFELYNMVIDYDSQVFAGKEVFKSIRDVSELKEYFKSREEKYKEIT